MAPAIPLIAIAGATCSGKTTVARALADALGAARVLSMDWYYRDLSDIPFEERVRCNFDHPDAIDHGLLLSQLERLLAGQAVQAPRYDFARHLRQADTQRVDAGDYVVLEGLHALHWEAIRRITATAVFLALDDAACLERRIARDVVKRGRSAESVRAQYAETVRPMFEQYVAPMQAHADVVVRGDCPVQDTVRDILRKLEGPGNGPVNP